MRANTKFGNIEKDFLFSPKNIETKNKPRANFELLNKQSVSQLMTRKNYPKFGIAENKIHSRVPMNIDNI